MIENRKLKISVKKEGYISELAIKDDPYKMNWVIEDSYLQQADYQDMDKLFGLFDITVDGKRTGSKEVNPVIREGQNKIEITYDFKGFRVKMTYDLGADEDALFWKIDLENCTEKKREITDFGIWAAFAYVMFRDKNVLRNIHNSTAVFPSISTDYTKLSMVRRDGTGTNLGLYQVKGRTKSVGTYCDYENLFFENVSPSLDGMLFHKLYLAGGYPQGFKNNDWIYEKDGFVLANIGYSNDFRAQNPDRWWEALTYMIHSLWGGITAAAAYKVFAQLKDTRYLEASYRATAGILYCYDTHSTTTTPLKKGMAASTYAVAGPHINRPDLSRDRFGQSTFYRDGGIFSRLFDNDIQTPDWDMGEEMVTYLENLGDKTFIMKKEDSVSVVNGSFEETDTEYTITSFAPYSREFYFISDSGIIKLADEKNLRKIILKKERI